MRGKLSSQYAYAALGIGLAWLTLSVAKAAGGPPAQGTSLFDAFKTFCFGTSANADRIRVAVKTAGGTLTQVPASTSFPFSMTTETWNMTFQNRHIDVSIGSVGTPKEHYDTCTVMGHNNDDTSIVAIQNWLNVKRDLGLSAGTDRDYAFETVGGIVRAPTTKLERDLAESGGFYWTLHLSRGVNFVSVQLMHPLFGAPKPTERTSPPSADADAAICVSRSANADARIEACSKLVGRYDNETNARLLHLLAIAHADKKLFDDAIQYQNDSIKLLPLAVAFEQRGIIYERARKFADAIADFTRALTMKQDSAFYEDRCNARGLGNIDLAMALDDCNISIRLASDSSGIHGTRGLVYLRLGQLTEALADFNTAIVPGRPPSADLYYMRGITRLKLHDASGGAADIAFAEKVSPDIRVRAERSGIRP